MFIRRLPLLLVIVGLWCACAYGVPQIPGLSSSSSTTAPQPPTAQPDPLGRESPRGCLLGFIKAAQEEKYSLAIQYFAPPAGHHHISQEDEEELAEQLLAILNQKFTGPLDFVSKDPQGRLDDGLPADQEKISSGLSGSDTFPILLVRLEDPEGRKLWYFSRATLDSVPEVFDSLTYPEIEKKLPQYLVEHRILGVPYWQWLGILLFIPVAFVAGRLLVLLLEYALRYWRATRHLPPVPIDPLTRVGPMAFMIALLIHYALVSYIGTSLLYRIYYRRIIAICLAIAFYWLLTRITRAISTRVAASLTSRGMFAERSIVSLIRRFVEVSIFILVTLIVLHGLGFDVSAALAGVGIGTLALGLGAQKTFENMFGGVSILFDKVILIGDTCKVNNQTGVVEDIGLRSTRLRTAERTLLSIPNGTMATAVIENLRFRDKFLCQQVIRLRYDLSPDHVRFVLEEIRQLLLDDPKVEDSSSRVRFLRFSDYSLDVEVYCYILENDYNAYLSTQEGLLLSIMDALDKAGVVVALPTQTTFVTQDSWIDPEKAKAAKAAIEKMRDPGVPGAQQVPPNS
ncbi:MAG TPA: mechanosensitive ion channel family protein [Verrucomicrobiae bacterium]|nr:mechanosensitive ion channel family protein [Verrucomicrobiae bacterium]